MADTFHVTTSLIPLAETVQLAPNPALIGEAGVTTAALLPTLGGNPGLPCVVGAAPFALFNEVGSNRLVNILEIDLLETQGRTATATNFAFGRGGLANTMLLIAACAHSTRARSRFDPQCSFGYPVIC